MIRIFHISVVIFLIIAHIDLYARKGTDSYASSSVLSEGQWFKIAVTSDGIYKIDYTTLKNIGLNNISYPKIFSNNSGQLSYYIDDNKPDDLTEIAIYIEKGSNNIFDDGDYILFYGEGTERWKYDINSSAYSHLKHNYSDTAYYFLTSGTSQGKVIEKYTGSSVTPDYYSSSSDVLYIHEEEKENLIGSGRKWYEAVSSSSLTGIDPGFANLISSEPIAYHIAVLARASVNTIFRLYENSNIIKSIQVQGINTQSTTGIYAQTTDSLGKILPASSNPEYTLAFFNNGESTAKGWLDYIQLTGRKNNIFDGNTTKYFDSRSVSTNRVTQYAITNSTTYEPVIWEITDPFNTKEVSYSKDGNKIVFPCSTDTLKTFIAFKISNALSPTILSAAVKNQNLHGSGAADMIIVTHSLFKSFAEKLADIHYKNDGLISQVVTPEEIYNEFSGGTRDICAIRNYLRMKYKNQSGTAHPLKYLLLFGDGSYENRTLPPNNPNFIPTYQSENSNVYVSSFTSDDFYGLLDDGEGEYTGTEDIGIGRLPVSDTTQAGIVLSKIIGYLDSDNKGDWKNMICLTADDEDSNAHIIDAENLNTYIGDNNPVYNIEKIYLDAYKQSTAASGDTYPDVTEAINDRVNKGSLIFNYTGHGSEYALAAERIITTEDINSWENGFKLPLFITATCEFSRFDDINFNYITGKMTNKASAGELILFNSTGGGIALMSTTRIVYSAPNYTLNKNIYKYIFEHDSTGEAFRLGDVIRLAKIASGNGSNKRNFSLLGDPALQLAYPRHGKVITDSVNHVSVADNIDSLKALSMITLSGHIENNDGSLADSFDGTVSTLVYDKESSVKTLANDGGAKYEFNVRSSIIFSGKTQASDGRFSISFIIPRDINYAYGNGKISYYAYDDEKDMNGSFSDIIVGGFANITDPDTTGPTIILYMNDTLFKNGGITDSDPSLLAILTDNSGRNATGSGIGHDITAFLDEDNNDSFILNNYFESDYDSYKKGNITYSFSDLDKGNHTLTLKAWDNYNNSSTESLMFVVETGAKFIISKLLNYPNPFFNETHITSEHNRPDEEFKIEISIYNMSGKIVKLITSAVTSTGYQLPAITWDGNDNGGRRVGRGIYPYKILIKTSSGETATASGKMIIL